MIIHIWKLDNGKAPNDIGMVFYDNPRLGLKVKLPRFNNRAQRAMMTSYENSFGVKAAKLWNILPKAVNMTDELESFKVTLGSFLATFPDKPLPIRITPCLT